MIKELVIFLLLSLQGIVGIGFHDIPGNYCSERSPTCCPNRDDQCTMAIMENHLCYCDMFCDRGQYGNDCCPDFKAVCRYTSSMLAQAANICSTCIEKQWKCDAEQCLIQEDLLLQIQSQRYTWTARNYSQFWGRTLKEGIRHRLGTLLPERSVQNMNEIIVKPRELPTSFDVRKKWPNFIHQIQDQGECASSWALSTAATSSDRLAVITEGRQNILLSAQQFLSCNQYRQKGCEGGYIDRAWCVVSEECYPYISGVTKKPEICYIQKSQHASERQCPSGHPNSRVYRTTPPYRVSSREKDIMSEILTNGPVQATFLVYGDFFMYSGGVYKHLPATGEEVKGYHSARLLGWGEDYSTGIPIKYWIAANSWGLNWGENGTFRILRGENHCEIESFVVAAWGKGFKKRRRLLKLRKIRRQFKVL